MSLSGNYQTSKIGATVITAFNGSAGAAVEVALQAVSSGTAAFVATSYAIRATKACRLLQGAAGGTAVTVTTGFLLGELTTYWRVDVESDAERCLSMLGDTATGGNIEVTCITRL